MITPILDLGGAGMYSERYEKAKKEFVNCMVMGVICLGFPFYNAYKEWWPIMKEEKQKALAAAANGQINQPAAE